MEKIYNKLVRDNIPEIIIANGGKPVTRVLSEEEYRQYLYLKDTEELEEVKSATTIDERIKELADKLEILIALATLDGISLDDVLKEADKKRNKNGGFCKRLLLEKVIE